MRLGSPLIGVHIVCTHDAVKLAETLMRLLGAEDYDVRISYGRQSIAALDDAENENDAVLLMWSLDAPSAHYMLEWAQRIDPVRLVEIGRTARAPRIDGRRAPVIDFTTWRGERGGRAWNALIERLTVVQHACAPKGPVPHRAAIGLGLAGAVAVGGAVLMRVHDVFDLTPTAAPEAVASTEIAGDGIGGPLQVVEPASADDMTLHVPRYGRTLAHVELPPDLVLADLGPEPDFELRRERTLFGRINDLTDEVTAALLGPRERDQTASNESGAPAARP